MGDEKTFTELINKIEEPVRLLNQMLSNKMISFKRMDWDLDNKRQVITNVNNEIELQKRVGESIRQENEQLKTIGEKEKHALIAEGLKFIAEAQTILKNVKTFATEIERRQYGELIQKVNEILPEQEAPKRMGRPPKTVTA